MHVLSYQSGEFYLPAWHKQIWASFLPDILFCELEWIHISFHFQVVTFTHTTLFTHFVYIPSFHSPCLTTFLLITDSTSRWVAVTVTRPILSETNVPEGFKQWHAHITTLSTQDGNLDAQLFKEPSVLISKPSNSVIFPVLPFAIQTINYRLCIQRGIKVGVEWVVTH